VDCRGRLLRKERPKDAKNLDWTIEVLVQGTKRSSQSEYRRGQRKVAESGEERDTQELDQVDP